MFSLLLFSFSYYTFKMKQTPQKKQKKKQFPLGLNLSWRKYKTNTLPFELFWLFIICFEIASCDQPDKCQQNVALSPLSFFPWTTQLLRGKRDSGI